MNSAPSSSLSLNGRLPSVNGSSALSSPHPDHDYSSSHESALFSSHNGYTQVPYHVHNEQIVHHLYHAGFQTGNYSDTILHVHQSAYRLHAIMLSRSPYLAHLMSTSPQSGGQHAIYVQLDHEPEVTQEGFAIALGYLYSPISLSLIRPENARGVLAAGCLLGGMDDLCAFAFETCRRSISVQNIAQWLEFTEHTPSSSNGSPKSEMSSTSIFGQYAQRLRDDIFNYLVVILPVALNVNATAPASEAESPQEANGRDTLLRVFSMVPFDLFKAAVESPTFQIGTDQARFKFAKDAIELRKGHGAEETVVLAFGGAQGGSAVHVTRKLRKRPLWKVNS